MRTVFKAMARSEQAPYVEDYDSLFQIPLQARGEWVLRYATAPVRVADGAMVFGHYFPVKYLGSMANEPVPRPFLATFLRNPLERLASHYAFWKRGRFPGHYLWRKMMDEAWRFETFALSPEMRNFYAQYLAGVPLSRFDFIGLCEELPESWLGFLRAAGLPYRALPHVNQSDSAEVLKGLSRMACSEIVAFHSEDYVTYQYAVGKFGVQA